jgi:hypothetical protein
MTLAASITAFLFLGESSEDEVNMLQDQDLTPRTDMSEKPVESSGALRTEADSVKEP